jgi:hypothetical protein
MIKIPQLKFILVQNVRHIKSHPHTHRFHALGVPSVFVLYIVLYPLHIRIFNKGKTNKTQFTDGMK